MTNRQLFASGVLMGSVLSSHVLCATDSPSETLLQYRFEPGQSLRVRTTSNSTMKLEIPGDETGKFTATLRSEINLVEKVVDLKDTIATLVTQTQEARMSGSGFGDAKGGFGSSYKDGQLSGYTISNGKKSPIETSGEWVANRFTRIDALGQRHPYEGKAPTSRDDYWRPSFPNAPLKVGDTWKTEFRSEQNSMPALPGSPPSVLNPATTLELSLTHKLTSLRKKGGRTIAVIDTVGTQREPKNSTGSSSTVIEAATFFDVDRGVILSATSHSTTDGKVVTDAETATPATSTSPLNGTLHTDDRAVVQFIESKTRK